MSFISSATTDLIKELMERPYHTVLETESLITDLRSAIETEQNIFAKVNRDSLTLWKENDRFFKILTGRVLYTWSREDGYQLTKFEMPPDHRKRKPIDEVTTEDHEPDGYDDAVNLVKHLRDELRAWEKATEQARTCYSDQMQVKSDVTLAFRQNPVFFKGEDGNYVKVSFESDSLLLTFGN